MQYGKVEICGINTSEIKVLKESEKKRIAEKKRVRAIQKRARS